jgi:hypothetical protein
MELTATVTGIVEGDELDYDLNWPETYEAGEYEIAPSGERKQGNYTVTFEKGKLTVTEGDENSQKLFNFLKMDGDNNYYRLKITAINAEPAEKVGMGKTLTADQYTIPGGEYNFSNLILTKNGEEYKFSATQPEGDFESCYTIKSVTVTTNTRITGQDSWFNNPNGYLDDSETQYKALGIVRTAAGFHRDYVVKLHKGKPVTHGTPMSIHVTSSWPNDKVAYYGAEITLTAELIGFEGKQYTLQWQRSSDRQNWENIPGENGTMFTYEIDDETSQYVWRIIAEDVQ